MKTGMAAVVLSGILVACSAAPTEAHQVPPPPPPSPPTASTATTTAAPVAIVTGTYQSSGDATIRWIDFEEPNYAMAFVDPATGKVVEEVGTYAFNESRTEVTFTGPSGRHHHDIAVGDPDSGDVKPQALLGGSASILNRAAEVIVDKAVILAAAPVIYVPVCAGRCTPFSLQISINCSAMSGASVGCNLGQHCC
jgi:hypothetical protein